MTIKNVARIENWFELPNGRLMGDVRGHARLGDANDCITSKIVARTESTVETLNTIYTLGTPADKGKN